MGSVQCWLPVCSQLHYGTVNIRMYVYVCVCVCVCVGGWVFCQNLYMCTCIRMYVMCIRVSIIQ